MLVNFPIHKKLIIDAKPGGLLVIKMGALGNQHLLNYAEDLIDTMITPELLKEKLTAISEKHFLYIDDIIN